MSSDSSYDNSLEAFSAVQTGELLDGQAGMYAFHLAHGSPLVGATLKELRKKYPDFTAIIVYLEREGGGEVPHGEDFVSASHPAPTAGGGHGGGLLPQPAAPVGRHE